MPHAQFLEDFASGIQRCLGEDGIFDFTRWAVDGMPQVTPLWLLKYLPNMPASHVAIYNDLRGPNNSLTLREAASNAAVGEAFRTIVRGSADVMVAGATGTRVHPMKTVHAITQEEVAGNGVDPTRASRPFDLNRSGMVLGEGAAVVVLESWDRAVARGAFIHGELMGYGLTTDTGHITQPSVDGQAAAMRAALHSAAIDASAVDAINAHGTGTRANDGVESAAIKAVFGERAPLIPISATKALHGHLLGATAALEVVLSLLAMQHSVALPTMHLQERDPECDLDYVPNAAREGIAIRTMLSNSFAFGGTNAVLALRAAP